MRRDRGVVEPHFDGGAQYLGALNRGEIVIPTCRECRVGRVPDRQACAACGSISAAELVAAPRTGTLWSWAEFHKSYRSDFHLEVPYIVAVIELGNVKIYANIQGAEYEQLVAGAAVQVRVSQGKGEAHVAASLVPATRESTVEYDRRLP